MTAEDAEIKFLLTLSLRTIKTEIEQIGNEIDRIERGTLSSTPYVIGELRRRLDNYKRRLQQMEQVDGDQS